VPDIQDAHSIRRNRESQGSRLITALELLEGSKAAASARVRIDHVERRIGRRIAGHVVHALKTHTKGGLLDAGDELPRRTAGKGLDEQRRVGILRLIDDALSAHCLAREPPTAALRDSL